MSDSNPTFDIPFTQYLRPNGRQVQVFFQCQDPAVADKAQRILAAGYRLECEELLTGEVSLTIGNEEEDLAWQLCPNGPEVPRAVSRLIMDFPKVR
jgi:hypothetical protein